MVRPFCRFRSHDKLLSKSCSHVHISFTHVLITRSYPCIHGVCTTLYASYNVFWSSKVSKAVTGFCRDTAFYIRHWVRHSPFNGKFGLNLDHMQLSLQLSLSFVLLCTLNLCCWMMFPTIGCTAVVVVTQFRSI